MVSRTIAILLVILLSSTGCSIFSPRVVQADPIRIVQPTMPREVDLKEPYFYVVNSENIDDFLYEVNEQSGQTVFVAMTISDYELMSYNIQELRRYIKDLGNVIVYYKKVTSSK